MLLRYLFDVYDLFASYFRIAIIFVGNSKKAYTSNRDYGSSVITIVAIPPIRGSSSKCRVLMAKHHLEEEQELTRVKAMGLMVRG